MVTKKHPPGTKLRRYAIVARPYHQKERWVSQGLNLSSGCKSAAVRRTAPVGQNTPSIPRYKKMSLSRISDVWHALFILALPKGRSRPSRLRVRWRRTRPRRRGLRDDRAGNRESSRDVVRHAQRAISNVTLRRFKCPRKGVPGRPVQCGILRQQPNIASVGCSW
jgi:hypothetical protein